ncbi:hypothetical protein COOONC_07745, partial [Cooperia oncophora]
MESILYGKPILHNVLTLRTLVERFKSYAEPQKYSEDDQLQFEEILQTIDLLKGSIGQIDLARSNIQTLVDKIKLDYDTTKNKEDRKNIQHQLESIEAETNFSEAMKDAMELSIMLNTRLTEAYSNKKRIARRLGLTNRDYHNDNPTDMTDYLDEPNSSTALPNHQEPASPSIPPPQPQKYSEDDQLQFEEILQTIDLLKGSIGQIDLARSNIQTLVDKIKLDYDTTKNKEDRKNIQHQLESIEAETNFSEAMKDAMELSIMLNTRLTEAYSNKKRIARRLGLTNRDYHNDNPTDMTDYLDEPNSSTALPNHQEPASPSIPPPR